MVRMTSGRAPRLAGNSRTWASPRLDPVYPQPCARRGMTKTARTTIVLIASHGKGGKSYVTKTARPTTIPTAVHHTGVCHFLHPPRDFSFSSTTLTKRSISKVAVGGLHHYHHCAKPPLALGHRPFFFLCVSHTTSLVVELNHTDMTDKITPRQPGNYRTPPVPVIFLPGTRSRCRRRPRNVLHHGLVIPSTSAAAACYPASVAPLVGA